MKTDILLAHYPRLTFKRYQQLLAAFSSIDDVWQATRKEFIELGWKDTLTDDFLAWRNALDIEKITKVLDREGIACITRDDAAYPPLLKEVYDPPLCLFVRGNIENLGTSLAVVGPRKYSSYGAQVCEMVTKELANSGVTIVSGLALGIDGLAHKATLAAKGKTMAVLGSGNNDAHIHPSAHRGLAEQIITSGGAVISEYPPGTLPNKYTFPRRNRIIAGMTAGTLVVEAGEKSGSLITAQYALDSGREVFAIPQNITSVTAAGTNNLLKLGAKMVTTIDDILENLNLQQASGYATVQSVTADSPTEATILEYLTTEPTHVDEIIKRSTLDSPTVNSTLTLMEMKGVVKNLGSMMYVVAR